MYGADLFSNFFINMAGVIRVVRHSLSQSWCWRYCSQLCIKLPYWFILFVEVLSGISVGLVKWSCIFGHWRELVRCLIKGLHWQEFYMVDCNFLSYEGLFYVYILYKVFDENYLQVKCQAICVSLWLICKARQIMFEKCLYYAYQIYVNFSAIPTVSIMSRQLHYWKG